MGVVLRLSQHVARQSMLVGAILLIASGWLHLHAWRVSLNLPHGLFLVGWATVMLGWGHHRLVWRLSILLFCVFTAITASAWLQGHSDCGCFPGITVHPAITTLLDVGMAAFLWATPPAPIPDGRWSRWWFTLLTPVALVGAWCLTPVPLGSTWPAPLDRGGWRVVALRDGCEHCSAVLSWVVPMANAAPHNTALVSLSDSDAWLRKQGLSQQVHVLVLPSRWEEAPSGWLVRDGVTQGNFEIPTTVSSSDEE